MIRVDYNKRCAFIRMFNTLSYVGSGLQAVLEIYLIRFLLVCSRKSSSLGTTFFNLYVAIYQLCSISGGLAADKLLGKSNSCDII